MKIFINAGHWDDPETDQIEDPGAVTKNHNESELVNSIRDNLKAIIPNAEYVPDNLNLRQSIAFVNERAKPYDIAISIHLNANKNENIRGTEAYYSNSSQLANIFSRCVSESLGVPNRGSKHDSESHIGSLGWLRKLKCRSVIIEACYLTNSIDDYKISIPSNRIKVAQGILKGINKLKVESGDRIKSLQETILELTKLLNQLFKIIIGINKK